MRHRTLYALGSLLIILSGCVIGQTIEYQGLANFRAAQLPDVPMTVAVWDRRPYVQNGDKTPQFVGLTRSGFGIPFPAHTSSGNALADDMARMISSTLKQQGKKGEVVLLRTRMSNQDMVRAVTEHRNPRILLFEMHEWKTDTYLRPTFHYNMRLSVLDVQGNRLAEESLSGIEPLDDNQRPERKNLVAATSDILGALINHPKIHGALIK